MTWRDFCVRMEKNCLNFSLERDNKDVTRKDKLTVFNMMLFGFLNKKMDGRSNHLMGISPKNERNVKNPSPQYWHLK